MSEPEPVPPAADMHWHDEDPDRVARVLVRVDYADGRIREYEAEEPRDFRLNELAASCIPNFASAGMAVLAPGSAPVPVFVSVPSLDLSFTANPRYSMHIRTERTAAPAQAPEEAGPGVIQAAAGQLRHSRASARHPPG